MLLVGIPFQGFGAEARVVDFLVGHGIYVLLRERVDCCVCVRREGCSNGLYTRCGDGGVAGHLRVLNGCLVTAEGKSGYENNRH